MLPVPPYMCTGVAKVRQHCSRTITRIDHRRDPESQKTGATGTTVNAVEVTGWTPAFPPALLLKAHRFEHLSGAPWHRRTTLWAAPAG
jgi:hypothetical protein